MVIKTAEGDGGTKLSQGRGLMLIYHTLRLNYVPGIVQSLININSFNLAALGEKDRYYAKLTEKKTETQRS